MKKETSGRRKGRAATSNSRGVAEIFQRTHERQEKPRPNSYKREQKGGNATSGWSDFVHRGRRLLLSPLFSLPSPLPSLLSKLTVGFPYYRMACFSDVRKIELLANILAGSIITLLLPSEYYCQ